MKRKITTFFLSLCLAAALVFGMQTAAVTEASEVAASSDEINSLMLNPGRNETEINLVWYYKGSAKGYVEYQRADSVSGGSGFSADCVKVEADYCREATNKAGYYVNKATISGLEPGVKYQYRVGNGSVCTEIYEYTVYGDASHTEFFYGSDAQVSDSSTIISQWKQSMQMMSNRFPNVNLLIHAGDLADAGSYNDGQYTNGFLAPDQFTSMIVGCVPGNHDEFGNGASYRDHVNQANQTDIGKFNDVPGDYYFTYNNILFMNLTSHTVAATDVNAANVSKHKEFIEQAIKDNPGCDWHIVVFHESIFSSARHRNSVQIRTFRSRMAPALEELDKEYGIDLVLQGHDHAYSRSYVMQGLMPLETENIDSFTDPDGIIYVTANCASGLKHYDIEPIDYPYLAVSNQEYTPNLSHVEVDTSADTTSLHMTTYRTVLAGGYSGTAQSMSVVDEFSITKTKQGMVHGENNLNVKDEEPKVATYSIQASSAKGGKVYAGSDAEKGTTQKIIVTTQDHYLLKSIQVKTASGKEVSLKPQGSGVYTFVMPGEKVSVSAGYVDLAAKVSGLKAVKSGKAIKVSWKKTAGATGYIVYRSEKKNGVYKQVARTTKLSCKDTKNLKNGRKYYYKVRAYVKAKDGTVEFDKLSSAKGVTYKK